MSSEVGKQAERNGQSASLAQFVGKRVGLMSNTAKSLPRELQKFPSYVKSRGRGDVEIV